MSKKYLIVLTILIVICALFVGCNSDNSKSFKNGNFESVVTEDGTTTVSDWTKKLKSEMEFKANIKDGSEEYIEQLGSRYAHISLESGSKDFDYMYQKIKLNKNKTYKLSADIFVEKIGVSNKVGAKVSFVEDPNFVGINITETNSKWTNYEYYFTSSTTKEVTIYVGLGNNTSNVYGTVSFDNIKLEEVDSVPSDYTQGVGLLKYGEDYNLSDGASVTTVVLLTIASMLILLCAYWAIRALTKQDNAIEIPNSKKTHPLLSNFAIFCYILVGAFLVRFLIAVLSYGFGTNIDKLSDIAKLIADNGFLSYYPSNNANEPMGIIYIMGIFGLIAEKLSIEYGSLGYAILARMPSIIMDIVTVFVIFSYASKYQSEKQGLAYSAIFALVPLFWTISALYASWDSVAISLIIIMVVSMLDKKYITSGICYVLSLMFSNYMLLLLPIVLLFQIYSIVVDKPNRVNIILTMVIGLVFFIGMSIIPSWSGVQKGNIFYYFKVMLGFFTKNTYLTQDSMNIYAIFGMANSAVRNNVLNTFNWMFVIVLSSVAVVQYLMHKNRLDLILSSAFIVITYAIIGANSQLIILPIGLALLLVYIVLVPDSRLYGIFAGLSTLSFLNIIQLISRSGYITGSSLAKYIAFSSKSAFLITTSVLAVALCVYFIYVVIDILFYSTTRTIQPLENGLKNHLKYLFGFKWLKKDR